MGDKQFEGTFSVLIPLLELGDYTSQFVLDNVNDSDLLRDPAVHKGEPLEKDPHVTVLMGLDEKQCEIARKICEDYEPFNMGLGSFTVFRTSKTFEDGSYHEYDVLVRRMLSPDLIILHNLLVSETGKSWHFPQYHAHLTYAYLKYGTGQAYADKFNTEICNAHRDSRDFQLPDDIGSLALNFGVSKVMCTTEDMRVDSVTIKKFRGPHTTVKLSVFKPQRQSLD
jgi:hypothetical protein